MTLIGSQDTGLGNVDTAGQPTQEGGGGGTTDRLVIGKFSGTLVQEAEGVSATYLSDVGELAPDPKVNDGIPQNYGTSARTIERLRVTSKSGTGGTALVVTLYKNNAPTAQTVTIPGGSPPVTIGADLAHPITFADGDTFDVVASMASGVGDGPYFLSAVLEGPPGGGGGGGGGGTPPGSAIPGLTFPILAGVPTLTNSGDVVLTHDLTVGGVLETFGGAIIQGAAPGDVVIDDPTITGGGSANGTPLFPATPSAGGFMSPIQWQQLGLDWWSQRTQHAIGVLNAASIQVDQPERFDYTLANAILYGGAPPVVDTTKSGTVYVLSAPGTGQLIDGPVAGANIVAGPETESWYVARKVSYAQPVGAANVIPLVLQATSTPAAPYGNNYIELTVNAGLSTTHHFLVMDNGTGAPFLLDLGPTCAIGGPLCPQGVPVTMAIYFSLQLGALVVEFQDVVVATLTASSGQLNQMPIVGLTLGAFGANSPTGMRLYGGFAMIKGPTT